MPFGRCDVESAVEVTAATKLSAPSAGIIVPLGDNCGAMANGISVREAELVALNVTVTTPVDPAIAVLARATQPSDLSFQHRTR